MRSEITGCEDGTRWAQPELERGAKSLSGEEHHRDERVHVYFHSAKAEGR